MSIGSDSSPLHVTRGLFVSWISHHGRSEDLARELGVECAFIANGTLTRKATAPLRHAVQLLRTVTLLARRRRRVLIVMAPPALLVLIGLAYRRVTGARLVVDC